MSLIKNICEGKQDQDCLSVFINDDAKYTLITRRYHAELIMRYYLPIVSKDPLTWYREAVLFPCENLQTIDPRVKLTQCPEAYKNAVMKIRNTPLAVIYEDVYGKYQEKQHLLLRLAQEYLSVHSADQLKQFTLHELGNTIYERMLKTQKEGDKNAFIELYSHFLIPVYPDRKNEKEIEYLASWEVVRQAKLWFLKS